MNQSLSLSSAFVKFATYQSVKNGKNEDSKEISRQFVFSRELTHTIALLSLGALAALTAFHFLGGPLDIDATTLAIAGGSIGGGLLILYGIMFAKIHELNSIGVKLYSGKYQPIILQV
jgi:hypothetical protein